MRKAGSGTDGAATGRQGLVLFTVSLAVLTGSGTGAVAGLARGAAVANHGAGAEDALARGRQIYREGRVASGVPITATVIENVTIEGGRAACVNCHQRSGLGTAEGTVGALSTNGATLYKARDLGKRPRPAYTDTTLAAVIRTGVDPTGRRLDPLMPRYEMSDREIAVLVAYLKTLSSVTSPGVTATAIHFATVLTDDVSAAERQAVLGVLETFFREKNGGTRAEVRRSQSGPFYRDFIDDAYRKWMLHRWLLTGSRETWSSQLDSYYRAQPVFALLSGISTGEWRPIHEFCERNRVPCLLPNTDLPVADDAAGFYTMYFSAGLALEARTMVAHASRNASTASILQVFRPDSPGETAARMLRRAAASVSGVSVVDWPLPHGAAPVGRELRESARREGTGAIALWLSPADLKEWEAESCDQDRSVRLYVSSTLLDAKLSRVPAMLRPCAFVVHPYSLPKDLERRFGRVGAWLKSRHLTVASARIQAQTYFACLLAGEGLMHIKKLFYRDYLLDSIDHSDSMAELSAFHPRLGFGPGQRFLGKGTYILRLGGGTGRADITAAVWIVP